ncbi:beta-galactosidase [Pedobacter sp. PLR]|uniref:glycoside hydrolase family 2 protein n=1 Tax=Pedobacter sp. PLR TaxID=2994465 RepID=UPI002247FA4B|nr:glycoside hydrolase family 2 TIM barrel-domain containing protein [Pedobacter sp. PLR]MCX2451861.1 beta-galactosidase [Pedobacter sp. PLR]
MMIKPWRPLLIMTALMLLLSAAVRSQNKQARQVIAINTDWQFKKDANRRDVALADLKWKKVSVPHTWNNHDIQTGKGFYAGDAIYQKELTAATDWKGKRVFIRFEGIGSVARLYVNDRYIGEHKGSYSAFAFEISYALKYGEKNKIEIKVNNEEREDVIPINNRLFPIYGGIYRPVSLIITNKVNIAVTDFAAPGVYISQQDVSAKSAGVRLKVKLENKSETATNVILSTSIYDATGKMVKQAEEKVHVSRQGEQIFHQQLNMLAPHLWNGIKDPYLYTVVIRIADENGVLDEITQPLGLRKFEMKPGKGFYLNDQPYRLLGVCRHQDKQDEGNALSNAQHLADLEDIKEMGATSIRFAHYQQSEYLYSRCDSMGFVIWAEIPFVNAVSTKEAGNAQSQLRELIRQNYNHPSIYVWGLHNEVYGKTPDDYTAVLTRDLNDISKTEDPDRYTVSVSGYGEMDRPTNLNADIQGMNRYYGWYEGRIGDLEQWVSGLEQKFPDYRMVLAEYGTEANIAQQEELSRDTGNPSGQVWPEAYQQKFHEIQWGIIAKHPYIAASYVWNMFDFAVPPANGGSVPARNMKGLVTYDRKVKKDAFYWYKANWNPEPMVYIAGRRFNKRTNPITTVTVYSNAGPPTLIVNGRKINGLKMGNTNVHYIFENVKLQKGKNGVEVVVGKAGAELKDQLEWDLI